MGRKQYSKSDIKKLIEEISYAEKIMNKKSNVVLDDNILYIDNIPSLIKYNDRFFPHLKMLLKTSDLLSKVTVDMGAIRFVIKGADIMRPGITKIEDANKGDLIVIIDETHGKPLAVGEMLFGAEEMREQTSGKVIKNIHYVGDEIWKLLVK